jgi:hypothetical protein
MTHSVFFALEIAFAIGVAIWGVTTLRRMDRRKKKPDT